jgi:hypothetical protein
MPPPRLPVVNGLPADSHDLREICERQAGSLPQGTTLPRSRERESRLDGLAKRHVSPHVAKYPRTLARTTTEQRLRLAARIWQGSAFRCQSVDA